MGVGRQQDGKVCLFLREQRTFLTAHTPAEIRGLRVMACGSTWSRRRPSTSTPRAPVAVTIRALLTRSVQQVRSARGWHLKL